jgi:hypothetical protein
MSESQSQTVMGVGLATEWQRVVRVRLTAYRVPHTFVNEATEAYAVLPSQDLQAIITMGMEGEGIRLAHAAHDLGIRAVLLSKSRIAVEAAKESGILAFHTNRPLNAFGIDPIIDAALGRNAPLLESRPST